MKNPVPWLDPLRMHSQSCCGRPDIYSCCPYYYASPVYGVVVIKIESKENVSTFLHMKKKKVLIDFFFFFFSVLSLVFHCDWKSTVNSRAPSSVKFSFVELHVFAKRLLGWLTDIFWTQKTSKQNCLVLVWVSMTDIYRKPPHRYLEAEVTTFQFPPTSTGQSCTVQPIPNLPMAQRWRWPGFGPVSCSPSSENTELLKEGKTCTAPGCSEAGGPWAARRQEPPLGTERDLVGRDQEVSEEREQ